jgi:hypothetical protein
MNKGIIIGAGWHPVKLRAMHLERRSCRIVRYVGLVPTRIPIPFDGHSLQHLMFVFRSSDIYNTLKAYHDA